MSDQIFRTSVTVKQGLLDRGVVHFSTTEMPDVDGYDGAYIFSTKDSRRLIRGVIEYTIEPEFTEPVVGWMTNRTNGETRTFAYTDLFRQVLKSEVEKLMKESPV